jgi:hypothetical protein
MTSCHNRSNWVIVLQLLMQSVPITTDVVSSNPDNKISKNSNWSVLNTFFFIKNGRDTCMCKTKFKIINHVITDPTGSSFNIPHLSNKNFYGEFDFVTGCCQQLIKTRSIFTDYMGRLNESMLSHTFPIFLWFWILFYTYMYLSHFL